jgi:hypothetical protein
VTWQLAAAVLLLAQGELDDAKQLARTAADEATPLQRRAHTIRLRGLAAHRPDLTDVHDLISIMEAASEN